MLKMISIALLGVTISSCSQFSTTLENSTTGSIKSCHNNGWGIIGMVVAKANQDDCISNLEKSGYKVVEGQ